MANNTDRKYFVKSSWIFNLESMDDKLWCMIYDIRDGEITLPIEVCGKVINSEDDIDELLDECHSLEMIAKCGRVTGREYGRIKTIVDWRTNVRYARCLASGMNERDAGRCFEDM